MKQLFFVMAAARQKDFSPSLVNEYGALSLFSNDSLFVCKKDKQPVGKGRPLLRAASIKLNINSISISHLELIST